VASFAPFMAAVTVTVEDAAEFPWLAVMYTVVGCGGLVSVDEGMWRCGDGEQRWDVCVCVCVCVKVFNSVVGASKRGV
jgi:hypothetical protein